MPTYDIYSKRLWREAKAGQEDVYQHDLLSERFINQILHIWRTSLGECNGQGEPGSNDFWNHIQEVMLREWREQPTPVDGRNWCIISLKSGDTLHALDLIEWTCITLENQVGRTASGTWAGFGIEQTPGDAIAEINARFRENGVGYEYIGGKLIRIDSQYLHAEAVKPAVQLLTGSGFAGASQEFLKAHEYYRHGDNKAAIAEALKAFESTMKAICAERKWAHLPGANAKDLINVVLTNNLVPNYMQTHLRGIRNVLEAGLPTVRNKVGGHGQGPDPVTVDGYFAAYALHVAASNIVFLVEAQKALPI